MLRSFRLWGYRFRAWRCKKLGGCKLKEFIGSLDVCTRCRVVNFTRYDAEVRKNDKA